MNYGESGRIVRGHHRLAGITMKRGNNLTPLAEIVRRDPTADTEPRARHHFTRFDQIDQLVGASEAEADAPLPMLRIQKTWSFCRSPSNSATASYQSICAS